MAVSKSIPRVVDRAEGVTDLGSENAHDGNHDDRDECENNRVLDEALTSFFRSK